MTRGSGPVLAALTLLLGACASLQHGDGGSVSTGEQPPQDSEADRLLQTDRDFAARAAQDPAAAWERFGDPAALQLPPSGEPAQGPAAIAAPLTGATAPLVSWQPRYAEVFESGDWGWTSGDWQLHEPGAAGRRLGAGRYASVWHRESDGSWKLRLDLGPTARRP